MYKKQTDKPISLGIATIKNINNKENDKPYSQLLKIADNYRKKYLDIPIGQIPGINHARNLFKSIKLDPTKYRPSSEALLRRALKNKPLPKINPAVDIGNWCSLEYLLPICVYDFDNIIGNIILRLGNKNEGYFAINNKKLNLENRFVLADDMGAFGSPITDSRRTMVTQQTKNLMLVIYFHTNIEKEKMNNLITIFAERTINILGGKLIEKILL